MSSKTPLSTQGYKGTRDFFPQEFALRAWIFEKMSQVCESYAYQGYDGPLLESFDLYAAKTGEEIVSQQLYSFIDRGDRKVALRPEMTPTLARMVASKINELPKPVRWYSIPNCFRYERPQRGRLREFWQLNVDVLGGDPVSADAEILLLSWDLMRAFGGEKFVSIKVNNRKLMDSFFESHLKLSSEQALKLTKLIDARSKMGEEKFSLAALELGVSAEQIGKLDRFFQSPLEQVVANVPCEGAKELERLFEVLKRSGLPEGAIRFDASVLRGLDYYTGTVFEMYDISPENNRAMFGGGRYDRLLDLFGKQSLAGVGLGMGDVTLAHFLETHGLMPKLDSGCDVFVTLPDEKLRETSAKIQRDLRGQGLKVAGSLEVSGFGVQLKQAAKLGAREVVLLGESELARGCVLVKTLATGDQREMAIAEVSKSFS
jgi:histidyl-tRNA synthetase